MKTTLEKPARDPPGELKRALGQLLDQTITAVAPDIQGLPHGADLVAYSRTPEHGDFSSNIALILSKRLHLKPIDTAKRLVESLPETDMLEKTEVASPGFINFFLRAEAFHPAVRQAIDDADFGHSPVGTGQSVLIELVSANPTGPLHVGHGRNAAYASALARLLTATGHRVECEYYINDAGRQMNILGVSIWLRHLQRSHPTLLPDYPEQAYQGDYIHDIASQWPADIRTEVPDHKPTPSDDSERDLDAWVECAQSTLGKDFNRIIQLGLRFIMDGIIDDLKSFKAAPDKWFHETWLSEKDALKECLQQLTDNGYTYTKDGAVWFQSTRLGDEKDRVLIRDNGLNTYFLADIAYHMEKFARGYDHVINVWGADHHGYVARLRAAISACGHNTDRLEIILLQFVSLINDKDVRLSMSTRGGKYITLRELLNQAGHDAARFFYLMRKGDQHLEFDIKLARSQSINNPMYYVQYAHARVCNILQRGR